MAVRVELIDEAVEDLKKYAKSGRVKDFLAKLLTIEDNGSSAGEPLGKSLATWRKIVVGNRDWRIVFRADDSLATVVVIGDRSDEECYDEALKRLTNMGTGATQSLAAVIIQLVKDQGSAVITAGAERR